MLNKKRKKRLENRRWHIHPIYQRRRQYGAYHTLVKELEFFEEKFFDYFRMSREQFAEILFMVINNRSTSSYDKFAIFREGKHVVVSLQSSESHNFSCTAWKMTASRRSYDRKTPRTERYMHGANFLRQYSRRGLLNTHKKKNVRTNQIVPQNQNCAARH